MKSNQEEKAPWPILLFLHKSMLSCTKMGMDAQTGRGMEMENNNSTKFKVDLDVETFQVPKQGCFGDEKLRSFYIS